MHELYHAHISTRSQKVRLRLAEKGLDWTGHAIEFVSGEHLRPAYLALNPNGVVPTLVYDGRPEIAQAFYPRARVSISQQATRS